MDANNLHNILELCCLAWYCLRVATFYGYVRYFTFIQRCVSLFESYFNVKVKRHFSNSLNFLSTFVILRTFYMKRPSEKYLLGKCFPAFGGKCFVSMCIFKYLTLNTNCRNLQLFSRNNASILRLLVELLNRARQKEINRRRRIGLWMTTVLKMPRVSGIILFSERRSSVRLVSQA